MGDEYGVTPGDYVNQVENEGKFTKESAQAEWSEKFVIRDTKDWRELLSSGPEKAKAALQYVIDNRDHFPQYNDSWIFDRRKEISQAEWSEKFGIKDTAGWQELLKSNSEKAKVALQYVIDNRDHFPQYNDSWIADRERDSNK